MGAEPCVTCVSVASGENSMAGTGWHWTFLLKGTSFSHFCHHFIRCIHCVWGTVARASSSFFFLGHVLRAVLLLPKGMTSLRTIYSQCLKNCGSSVSTDALCSAFSINMSNISATTVKRGISLGSGGFQDFQLWPGKAI